LTVSIIITIIKELKKIIINNNMKKITSFFKNRENGQPQLLSLPFWQLWD
jgi:hypothetical protein